MAIVYNNCTFVRKDKRGRVGIPIGLARNRRKERGLPFHHEDKDPLGSQILRFLVIKAYNG